MITEAEYKIIREKGDGFSAWLNGRTSYFAADVPSHLRITNEERSAAEVYEFCTDKPLRYGAYINEERRELTTYIGEKLAKITYLELHKAKRPHKPRRVNHWRSFVAHGINGVMYFGRWYDNGYRQCVTIRAYKNQEL